METCEAQVEELGRISFRNQGRRVGEGSEEKQNRVYLFGGMSLDESEGTGLLLRLLGLWRLSLTGNQPGGSAHTRTGSGTQVPGHPPGPFTPGEVVGRETSHLVLGGHPTLGKACVRGKACSFIFFFWRKLICSLLEGIVSLM